MFGAPSFEDCPSVFLGNSETSVKSSKNKKSSTTSNPNRSAATPSTADARTPHSAANQRHSTQQRQISSVYCSSSLSFSSDRFLSRKLSDVDHLTLTKQTAPISLTRAEATLPTPSTHAPVAQLVRPMPYHPHTNSSTAEANPRAALRLLVHLLNALRSTGGSGKNCVSMNHYVDSLHVNNEDNYVRLEIDVQRLFEHSPFANSHNSGRSLARHVFDSDLSKALDNIRIAQGPTVQITIVPVISNQRTADEFIDQFAFDDVSRKPRDHGVSRMHYFQPLSFVGPVKKRCNRFDIVCGFVVPDVLEESHLLADHDTLPFEPMFFEKMCCLFQWFNGDATSSRNGARAQNAQSIAADLQSAPRALGESDIISAFASAVHQRPSLTAASSHPLPQWYQPFSVRLPHHLASVESHSTVPAVVGSSVNTLEHGLRPLSLPLASDLLDRSLILAVLRLCNDG
ncbi:Hypothetical protein, putative [Bodo saltans]|uniref:Uncharacterized protein n=1 Tax=Bodo saltans TaxID=75058 RepID=A0A0S4JRA2_BODSA|nr:Hypothetical protein, putative [Bodo saltans]|eukprot:CUG93094.1 Hypothetical protein, putative [Bodo saltans]